MDAEGEIMSTSKMNAYDYERQQWVSGEAARELLISQTRAQLELLQSPRGVEYMAMTQKRNEPTVTLAEAIEILDDRLTMLLTDQSV